MADLVVSDLGGTASAQISATSVLSDTASSASSRRTRTHRSNLSVLIDELNREVRSNSDDTSLTETRVTSGAEPKISAWTRVVEVLKAIGTVCAVTCPPVPARIVRKVAFHPPPKNSGYTLQLDAEQRLVKSAKEVVGKPFTLLPTPMRGLTPHDYAHIMERITATTVKSPHGNDLVVIHVRARVPRETKQITLMTQPNSSDLGHFLQPHCINFMQVADSLGTDLYAFDYSGFGYSTGYPSERHIYADTLAVFEHVRLAHPDLSVCLLGYSIGTAAAVDVAYRKALLTPAPAAIPPPLSGMILVAPFTSAIRLLSSQPARDSTCCFDPFSNSDKISNIDLPILIVHGTEDSMVPLEHSTALASRLRHPLAPFIVQGADHQTVFGCNPSTFRRMCEFVRHETLVGKTTTMLDTQPVAQSVLATRSEKTVPVVSRCTSVESIVEVPSSLAPSTMRGVTPAPPSKTPVIARSKEVLTPLKTAQAKSPELNTAKRAATPMDTARAASPRPFVASAYYPCHTPIELAEIEQMQRKIASLDSSL